MDYGTRSDKRYRCCESLVKKNGIQKSFLRNFLKVRKSGNRMMNGSCLRKSGNQKSFLKRMKSGNQKKNFLRKKSGNQRRNGFHCWNGNQV
jgi:hypothetical protein